MNGESGTNACRGFASLNSQHSAFGDAITGHVTSLRLLDVFFVTCGGAGAFCLLRKECGTEKAFVRSTHVAVMMMMVIQKKEISKKWRRRRMRSEKEAHTSRHQ